MKKFLYLVIMLTLTIMLLGLGNNDQDKVIDEHFKALDAGKLDVAFSYLSKSSKQKLEREGGSSRLAPGANQLKQHKGIKSIKILDRKVVGQNTVLRISYKLNDGSELFDNIPLTNEDGKWKIIF